MTNLHDQSQLTGIMFALLGDSCVCLAGFVTATSVESCGVSGPKTCGCTDAVISEYHLTLTFPGRVEVWDIQKKQSTPKWSMEINTQSG